MTFKFNMRTGLALLVLPFLAACSETSVLDAFDSGNRAEENGAIVSNQPLSVPPDLSLRQPGAANAPAYNRSSNGLQVQQGQRATNQAYQAPPPPQPQGQQPAWQNSARCATTAGISGTSRAARQHSRHIKQYCTKPKSG